MNPMHQPTMTPHQQSCYDRAVSMHYCGLTAMIFARVALHAQRENESPAALALRIVCTPQQSAMVRL